MHPHILHPTLELSTVVLGPFGRGQAVVPLVPMVVPLRRYFRWLVPRLVLLGLKSSVAIQLLAVVPLATHGSTA